MHMGGWESTDDIYTGSHCSRYKLTYNAVRNTMIPVEIKEADHLDIRRSDEQTMQYMFRSKDMPEEAMQHVPKWENYECIICGYKLDAKLIEEAKTQFEKYNFMN